MAEGRKLGAGVIQWIGKLFSSCLYGYMIMFFENISQLKALSKVKIAPEECFVLNTLLRRGVLMVRYLTNAWRSILCPIG